MDWTLEVIVLPVADIDRSIAFYRDQLGFLLDHDVQTEQMRVVQLTPRGSGCSVVLGMSQMEPGTMTGMQLVVSDATVAREELLARGVEVSELRIFDPERDGSTFFFFDDPDGNGWAVQQMTIRADKPLIPHAAR
jgi:predicted enzyme related to lactoylglutathione lyase